MVPRHKSGFTFKIYIYIDFKDHVKTYLLVSHKLISNYIFLGSSFSPLEAHTKNISVCLGVNSHSHFFPGWLWYTGAKKIVVHQYFDLTLVMIWFLWLSTSLTHHFKAVASYILLLFVYCKIFIVLYFLTYWNGTQFS